MLASLNGRIESMKALIASGVDVKAATDIGMTSVHYACKQVESQCSTLWMGLHGDARRLHSAAPRFRGDDRR